MRLTELGVRVFGKGGSVVEEARQETDAAEIVSFCFWLFRFIFAFV